MIRYTFASLGKFESIGVRLGGAGLGNILFPWANAVLYARKHELERIATTWRNLKIGTFRRKELDKRMYFNLFTGIDGIKGFRKFLLLNFSNRVKIFSGMHNLFEPFKHEHQYIKSELLKITNPHHIKAVKRFNSNSIAIHIRMGDFEVPKKEEILRNGNWGYRLPLDWYKSIIEKIRAESTLPIYIFSDGSDEDLKDILELQNCSRVDLGSAISDMLALSSAKVLVASASTFSMWSSFLGQNSTIWFPGQMRQKLIKNSAIFEGEIDYDDSLDIMLLDILNDA